MLLVLNVLQLEVMVFFLRCLRQILQNMASLSNTSHSHKVNHFDWNFLSLLSLLAGLESVELILQDGPSNSTVVRDQS